MDERAFKLYDKCECMSLLCGKACNRWSLIKFIFQIPLILTSSVMCILNSFDNGVHIISAVSLSTLGCGPSGPYVV